MFFDIMLTHAAQAAKAREELRSLEAENAKN